VFVDGKTDAILPIPCSNLAVENSEHDIKLMPTRAIVTLPKLTPPEWSLSQFTFVKDIPEQRERVPFQHIELYAWGSSLHEL
jgi:hypothetical protein